MEDPNWIGVACCIVFVAHDDATNLKTSPGHRYSYYTDFDQDDTHIGWTVPSKKRSNIIYVTRIHVKKELVTLESDHLFILFLPREQFISFVNYFDANGMHDLDKLVFKTTNHQPQGLDMEVKYCGYRWVFEEDLQHFNPNTMLFSGNSTTQMHKLLTVE
ncbi:hypothetical protein RJT34_28392 [Clitoria ternatea]|uniref:Uncharacterized protein n=1 Tax=Clitoria ternatea TaxID=43366 RepID=A0AAN9FDX6_CLITE